MAWPGAIRADRPDEIRRNSKRAKSGRTTAEAVAVAAAAAAVAVAGNSYESALQG